MIRTLAVAAAAAAVGYAIGKQAAANPESRFKRDQPTESGVGVDIGDRRALSSDIGDSDVAAHRIDWTDNDEDGRVGR
jgi:hypothetical protein